MKHRITNIFNSWGLCEEFVREYQMARFWSLLLNSIRANISCITTITTADFVNLSCFIEVPASVIFSATFDPVGQ